MQTQSKETVLFYTDDASQLLLTCMFICKLDETVGDVSPSVETNYLGLHVPTGSLKERRDIQVDSNKWQHLPVQPCNFPRDLAPLCTYQAVLKLSQY